jgi:hypothetical protein
VNAYLNVPVYAAFHEWLGARARSPAMWKHWREGDRKAAAAAIPDSVVDELIVHGLAEQCREHIARYVANGVTTPVIGLLPLGVDRAPGLARPRHRASFAARGKRKDSHAAIRGPSRC